MRGGCLVRFNPDTDQRLVRWYWFADTAADAEPITIAEGSHLTSIDGYVEDATASIAGTVFGDNSTQPLAGSAVDLFTAANTTTPLRSTTAAADGSYAFTGLATGDYKLRFSNGANYRTQWYFQADSAADASAITLTA